MVVRRSLVALFALVAVALFPIRESAADHTAQTGKSSTASAPAPADTALFAGGCFWSMENAFEGQPGVREAISGYSGGKLKNPTYDDVNTEQTGHRETVRIVFDPKKTSYDRLLDIYWHYTNPMQANGQFCDRGDSYRPAIFVRNDAQKQAALASKAKIEKSGVLTEPIVTEIRPAMPFYPAEEYHQDFAKRNAAHYAAYRAGCGRDRSLAGIWGKDAFVPLNH